MQQALFLQAQHYAAQQDLVAAIRCAKAAGPQGMQWALDLSQWCLLEYHFEEAFNIAEQGLRQYGDHPLLYDRLATAALYLDQPEIAMAHSMKALTALQKHYSDAVQRLKTLWQQHASLDTLLTQLKHLQYHHRALLSCQYNHYTIHYSHEHSMPTLLAAGRYAEARTGPLAAYRASLCQYPYWRGELLSGRHIVILPEQGIGDELLHASSFKGLIKNADKCTIVCDPRLEKLFTRSFPEANIIGETRECASWEIESIDYLTLGLSISYYQKKWPINDWVKLRATSSWPAYLATLPPGLKVGLSWRSGHSYTHISGREKFYFNLMTLLPLLKLSGITWINLQYDQPEEELGELYRKFDITIHQPPVDLLHDIEGVMQLLTHLDFTITPENSLHIMSASVHCQTLVLRPFRVSPPLPYSAEREYWITPIFPSARYFCKPHINANWDDLIPTVQKYIIEQYL